MEEPFDRHLIKKIKQVFDDYEDPLADYGWAELRKKYPSRRVKRPLILWMSSAAAILLVLSGLWFYKPAVTVIENQDEIAKSDTDKINTKGTKKENANESPLVRNENQVTDSTAVIAESNKNKTESRLNPVTQSEKHAFDTTGKKLPGGLPEIKITPDVLVSNQTNRTHFRPENETVVIKKLEQKSDRFSYGDLDNGRVIITNPAPVVKDKLLTDTVEDVNPSMPVINALTKTDEKEKPRLSDLPEMPAENNKKISQKTKKMAFSVYAGSYFNYAEGSQNNLNFGAGVLSDIPLSRNLKLSTGLSIAKNTLNFNTELPQTAVNSLNSASFILDSKVSGNYNSVMDYQADLLALDIPINLKYQILPESNTFYVSAGLSSGAFISEKYTYQYQTFAPASANAYAIQSKEDDVEKNLNSFNLARTLNFSFGLSTNLGKTQNLTFEPFLKYPLGGLGSQNLRFGAAGINLKLNFKPAKK